MPTNASPERSSASASALPPARGDEQLIAEARERFLKETASHEMHVLHDDGLYRHLRFKSPDTVTYYFDLVTWPGHLAISGDCGDFVFARVQDMFDFFAPAGKGFADERWGINPHYWSEKLQAPRPHGALRYSDERFRLLVAEWLADVSEELEPEEALSLRAALEEQVLSDYSLDEHEAHRLLAEFEHDGRQIYDSWEWDLRQYDWSFLWCCWAIVWGIERYRAEAQPPAKSRRWRLGRSR